jgi:ankyrin repeat protein
MSNPDDIDLKELKLDLVARTSDNANRFRFNDNKMTAFHLACQYNILNLITFGVNNKHVDVNLVDGFGQTALVRALNSESRKVVNILIKCDRIEYNVPNDFYKITLLEYMFECYRKYDDLKARFSNKNVNINVNAKNDNNNSAIHFACLTSHISGLKLLIEDFNADINIKGNNDMTPLMIACSRNFYDAVSMLLNNDKIDVNIKDRYGMSALHYACKSADNNIIKALMNHPNIDFNVCTNDGVTPFMILCSNNNCMTNNKDIFEMFISNDAIDKKKIDTEGNNAFSYQMDYTDEKRIRFLQKMYNIAPLQLINSLKK